MEHMFMKMVILRKNGDKNPLKGPGIVRPLFALERKRTLTDKETARHGKFTWGRDFV